MTGMTIPCFLALHLLAFASTVEAGDCNGNDSRCANSGQSECNRLQNEGADCRWAGSGASTATTSILELEPSPGPLASAAYTTSFEPEPAPELTPTEPITTSIAPDISGQGSCEGNDSRCAGSNQGRCNQLENEGSDCRWRGRSTNTEGVGGDCLGNDSRCATSGHAKCLRLSQQGSDCRWESSASTSSSSGACAGNDSRCSGKSEQSCDFLSQEGADCKWRADFTLAGSLTMQVTNASSFAENPNATVAISEGIANLTRVPSDYIDVDLHVVSQRRLDSRALAQREALLVTYVITVGSHVPSSVVVTSGEIDDVMKASNINQIDAAISSQVQKTFGNNDFNVAIAEVAPTVLISSSASTNTTNSSSSNSSLISTTAGSSGLGEDSGVLLSECAHPLLLLLGIALYLL